MEFDLIGFLIFLGFILPGFVAGKARDSIVPRSLKPISPVAEVGEFVLTGVVIHVLLFIVLSFTLPVFAKSYYVRLVSSLRYGSLTNFFWSYGIFALLYFILSLFSGYAVGLVQGWQVMQQPIRTWISERPLPSKLLASLGIQGFLQEEPVWHLVFKQKHPNTKFFLEIEMQGDKGFYTGQLASYALLDDSVKSKDFYIQNAYFKAARADKYVRLDCTGLLLNFADVISIQLVKVEPPS